MMMQSKTPLNKGPNSIASHRQCKGLTQEQLVLQSGITVDYLDRLETRYGAALHGPLKTDCRCIRRVPVEELVKELTESD